MHVIIAGSRDIHDYQAVLDAIAKSQFTITQVVSGCADGVDKLGEQYATKQHIPIKQFPADWNQHGRAAGPIRNTQMAKYAHALIAVWDGKSRGTAHMISIAKQHNLKVYVHII